MDAKRLAEWLGTADGLVKVATGLIGSIVALLVAITGQFKPLFVLLGLPEMAWPIVVFAVFAAVALYFWRDYRRYTRQSRLEQPDKFTLVATTPESLIGRADDLERLVRAVMQNRIVLLDGESGCGKSALVASGLVPRLQSADGLLPVLVRDWGDDWARGPLAATLEALHGALTTQQRELITWPAAPDLAAPAPELAGELSDRLSAVAKTLKRRPLLIADQFDDHQAQHRREFIDAEGSWATPAYLAKASPLWALVSQQLQDGQLHLLAVTRADTASGLSCLRFLDNSMITNRTLPEVQVEYLRPLLAGIAPDGAMPAVVSNPENGWVALRDILETHLRARGAVLMQQVRILLLGLRQLPVLTPRAYRRAGGMSGVETLVVTRALRTAAERLGGGEAGVRAARAMLTTLVLPAGADLPPKTSRQSLSELSAIAGSPERAQRALEALQADEIVRPAGGDASESAWQLDHDYLARSVLAEARQADRWGTALGDGFARFRAASGSWSGSWATLLPIRVQIRLVWEKLRGRLQFGEAAGYAWLSGTKPAALLVGCGSIAWAGLLLYEDNRVQAQAQALANQFGAGDVAAVLDAWQAPDAVRTRLFKLATADPSLLYSGSKLHWTAAHVGVEPDRALEVATLLTAHLQREQGLERDQDARHAVAFAGAYAGFVQKLQDQSAIKTAAEALRSLLEHAHDRVLYDDEKKIFLNEEFASAYAGVVQMLQNQNEIKTAAEVLRGQMEGTRYHAAKLASAYAAVAEKLQDQNAIKTAAEALRGQMERAQDESYAYDVANAYAAVAQKLLDQNVIKTEAQALRDQLGHAQDATRGRAFAKAYTAVAQKLLDQDVIKTEAEALRGELESTQYGERARAFASAYAAVAQKLVDQNVIKTETKALRDQLRHAQDVERANALADAYGAVAQKLQDQNAIETEAEALRGQMEQAKDEVHAALFARAYVAVAQNLQDQDAIKAAADVGLSAGAAYCCDALRSSGSG
jgi:hypothetical protein